MNRLLLVALSCLLVLSSCMFNSERITGNGQVRKEPRQVGEFNSVDASTALTVYIRQDASNSVMVETDENLQPYIEISERNGTLYIRQRNNTSLSPTGGTIKIYVSAPVYKMISASGATKLIGENALSSTSGITLEVSGASNANLELRSPSVSADLTGASSLIAIGETKDLSIEASGASDAKCLELFSENADVHVSGASSAQVYASVRLNAEASGASGVKYKGKAAVTSDANGASNISKID
ncbi:MAG: DUF2807 domain-containing protein [Chitinophagaceae bacterium]|nr:DUF2807 domain-containing protein [Chitinophagaceae bacterium]